MLFSLPVLPHIGTSSHCSQLQNEPSSWDLFTTSHHNIRTQINKILIFNLSIPQIHILEDQ